MIDITPFIYFIAIFGTIILAVFGVGIGEGTITRAAIDAINIQPQAKNDINKTLLLGMALVETAAILALITAFFIISAGMNAMASPLHSYIALLGMAIAVGIPGLAVGIFSARPAQQACLAIARQPFMAQKILRLMLIAQSLIQTPVIFGFISALLIFKEVANVDSLPESLQCLAAGIAIGLGSIGPVIGLGTFSRQACQCVGINKNIYTKILSFTFISNAIIETPSIFAIVVSVLILTAKVSPDSLYDGIRLMCAAFSIGFGTLGAGISSGRTAAQACYQISLHERQFNAISRTSMIAQGLIDTCAIYPLLGALTLIFA